MNEHRQQKELLSDVFAEAPSAEFRGALLGKTLRLARRRRRWQKAQRIVVLLIMLGIPAFITWQRWSRPTTMLAVKSSAKINQINYQLVRTETLSTNAIIITQLLATRQIVISAASECIVTTTRGNFRTINDDELLALVAYRPAALIRIDAHSERLVFANPGDEHGFPVP